MKKTLSLLLILLFSLITITKGFAELTNTNREKANYTMIALIYKNDLLTINNGKKYIELIDSLIIKNVKDKKVLSELKDKSKLLFEENEKKGNNSTKRSLLGYINAQTNIALLNFGTDDEKNKTPILVSNNDKINNENENKNINEKNDTKELSIKIIADKRNNDLEKTFEYLRSFSSLKNAGYSFFDFNDSGVNDYLIENGITSLPAIILNKKDFDTSHDPERIDSDGYILKGINEYLLLLPNGEYILPISRSYNPFINENKKNNNKKLTQKQINDVKEFAYYQGNTNPKFSWIEYGDLECLYCAKLNSDGIYDSISAGYPFNYYFINFPIESHKNAKLGAEVLECFGKQKGSSGYYNLLRKYQLEKKYDKLSLVNEAINLGADKYSLNDCIEKKEFENKIKIQKDLGHSLFGINATPTVVIINNYTLEYVIITGALNLESFQNELNKIIN